MSIEPIVTHPTRNYSASVRLYVDLAAEVTPPPPDGFEAALDTLVASIEDSDDLHSLAESPAEVEFNGDTYSVEFSINGAVDAMTDFSTR